MARFGWSNGPSMMVLIGAASLFAASQPAAAAEAGVSLAIASGPLDKALLSLSAQSNTRIVFDSGLVDGFSVPELKGHFTVRQALERLLAGHAIEIVDAGAGVIVLRPARTPTTLVTTPAELSRAEGPLQAATSQDSTLLDEVVVGSHIRGTGEGPSPVIVVSRDSIDRSGFATVADALTALPQAFGGTASDDAGTLATDPTSTNQARATGVNLRGLGADATLVLVNGRRMAGAGLLGDFADVSSIPLAAVARVDVLLDGASALYGSDAVGGVVNIVMRDRYDGAETRARIGGSTRGGLAQQQFAQTFGRTWTSGSVLISGEYQRRERLRGAERSFTGNADLRPFGGTDHRLYYSQPGTVLGIDPVTQQLVPLYAIPAGQNGVGLKPTDFIAGQSNLENRRAYMDVMPSQERGSVYLAVNQDIGSRVTLTADARYSDRRFATILLPPLTALTVRSSNPYFASPNGATSNIIAYSLAKETGGIKSAGEVQSRGLTFGAKVRLAGDWRAELYGVHAEEIATSLATRELNSAFLNEALGNTADSPLTSFSAARDGYFNPYIGQGRNSQAVLDFVTSGFDSRRTVGLLDSVSLSADGTLFQLPAGAVRVALGTQLRDEGLKTIGVAGSSGLTPVPGFTRRADRRISGVFAEARVPLFGADYRRAGFERLELSAAVRREHYTGGISSTVPKVGVLWSPITSLTLKATYGESFRAPSLSQQTDIERSTPTELSNGATTVLTLLRYGGNANLKPETAKSWTATIEYAPPSVPGARVTATMFDTRFANRIGQPAIENIETALTAPDLAPFRTFINPTTNPADLALVQELLKNASSAAAALYPASAYRAIADARYVNTGAFQVRGLDLSGAYPTTVMGDRVEFNAAVSWLIYYRRKVTPTAQAVDLAGLATYPADLQARASATWSHADFNTTLSLRRTGELKIQSGGRVKSQSTADLQVQYVVPAKSGLAHGMTLALTVQNLFDQDPPFYDSVAGVGYDPANYDPLGRVVAFQLIKAW
jgi:outer membrane receptor protein involved in Fe transport